MSSAIDPVWAETQRARWAQPDHQDRRLSADGRLWIRNLGKRCPHCPNVFFAYQVEGEEREPYRTDPNPIAGKGVRETCGHPACHEQEDNYQFQRRLGFRVEAAKARAHVGQHSAPKSQPALL